MASTGAAIAAHQVPDDLVVEISKQQRDDTETTSRRIMRDGENGGAVNSDDVAGSRLATCRVVLNGRQ